jgi:hypothetical protein
MTLLLFASNSELSKNLSVFVPLGSIITKKNIRKNTYG